jgi:orotate phosphoribosyltransferase
VLVDRSGGKADLGVRLEALLVTETITYEASHCPLCNEGTPAVKPGSRNI